MAETQEWILYYHPKLAGRAEFVRMIFEECGVAFKEINDNMAEFIMGGKHGGYPAFAPPMIKKGMAGIDRYIALVNK